MTICADVFDMRDRQCCHCGQECLLITRALFSAIPSELSYNGKHLCCSVYKDIQQIEREKKHGQVLMEE
jgi:hypothetical protein